MNAKADLCCGFGMFGAPPSFSNLEKLLAKRVEDKGSSFITPDFIKGRHLAFILAFSHSNFAQFCLVILLWKTMTLKGYCGWYSSHGEYFKQMLRKYPARSGWVVPVVPVPVVLEGG